MERVHCVACAGLALWEAPRKRYQCTACGLAFEASSASAVYGDMPDVTAHLVTAHLPDMTGDPDLAAPSWNPGRDVPHGVSNVGGDPLVVWNLELDTTASDATTDGNISS